MASQFALQIRSTIDKHRMLDSQDRVLVGVSGGADSVGLVLVLTELGYDPAVAHVNHGLRGAASDEDEEFTRELAEKLGLSFFVKKVSLPTGNIEAAGRAARQIFFSQLVRDQGFTKIAVAHTRDDRVETFLMNLLRGSGSEGLISMSPISDKTVRPLIETTRAEVEAYLEGHNQIWRTDSTNFDFAYARNRLRHGVIPRLVSEFNPNFGETLVRTIEILEGEDAWMRSLTDQWLGENGTKHEGDFVIFADRLGAAPVGFVRRVIRSALRRVGSDLRDVTFDHIEAVRDLLRRGKSGKRVEIPGGLVAAREFDLLVFRRAIPALPDYEYELKIPGHILIPELGKVFRAEVSRTDATETSLERVIVDGESIGAYVRIRNWRAGDYYRPVGLPAGKLKKLFQRARIPRSHRSSWPVVVSNSTIVWAASFPVSRDFVPGGRSQRIVVIEALPAGDGI